MEGAKVIVNVRRAEGLLAKDKGGTSDPFANVILGKQKFKTKVIEKTLSPEWEETFTLQFDPKASNLSLDIVLYDHDKNFIGSSAEFLGAASIDLSELPIDTMVSDWHDLMWNKDYQKKQEAVTGRILLDVRIELPDDGPAPISGDPSRREASMSLSQRKMSAQIEVDAKRLIVCVRRAEDLVAKDKGGTSDPFCEVHVGKEKKSTDVRAKTLRPEWNQTLTFDNEADAKALYLVLHDEDKGFFSNRSPHAQPPCRPGPLLLHTDRPRLEADLDASLSLSGRLSLSLPPHPSLPLKR